MWASLIPVAISLVSSLTQNKQRKEYQEILDKQNMTIPSGITEAEQIYKQLANVGLPGAENIKENIFAAAAGNLSEARRTTGNMSDYLEILNRAFTGAEDRATGVDVQDATMKATNKGQLAQFLAGTKAPFEQQIQEFNIQKALDSQREKMNSTNNIFNTVEAGVGAGMDFYGKSLYLDYQKEYLDNMKNSWNNPGGMQASNPATVTPPSAFDFSNTTTGGANGTSSMFNPGGAPVSGLNKANSAYDAASFMWNLSQRV
jgi:hypothetical protein